MSYVATCPIASCQRRFSSLKPHCQVCHRTFTADSVAGKHRTGDFWPPEARRCMTDDEMRKRGWHEREGRFGPEWAGERDPRYAPQSFRVQRGTAERDEGGVEGLPAKLFKEAGRTYTEQRKAQ